MVVKTPQPFLPPADTSPEMERGVKRGLKAVLFVLVAVALQTAPRLVQAADVGYEKGFFILSTDKNFKLKFNFQIQPRHEYVWKEAEIDSTTFVIARLRSYFTGHVFSPSYRYFLAVEYSITQDKLDKGAPMLRAGFAEVDITKFLTVTAGQFGVEVDREDEYGPHTYQLIPWSTMYEHFSLDYDLGIKVEPKIWSRLGSYVFFQNGDGKSTKNKTKKFLFGSRLNYSVLGEIPAPQGDYDYSEDPGLAIGTSLVYDFGNAAETEDLNEWIEAGIEPREDRLIRGDIDGVFNWRGLGVLGQWQFVRNSTLRTIDHGFAVQGGYFIFKKKLEAAARYSVVYTDIVPALAVTGITADSGLGGIPVREVSGGLNYFVKGHNMKLQTTFTRIMNRDGFFGLDDNIIRTQLTLTF